MTTICQVCGESFTTFEEHVFFLCDRCCTHERTGPGDYSPCDCYDCGATMGHGDNYNVHNCRGVS